jgi:fructose-1,6-bisphosphatase
MKKIIPCIALLMLANSVYSQQTKPTTPLTKKDYLQKSKNQKTAGWIFMGGGIGLSILGFQADSRVESNKENSGRTVAIITGLAAISVGTTLFIAATNNKNRAESLSFKIEKTSQIQQGSLVYRSFPAISFRLNL